jgi:coatomer subunit beta
MLTSPLLSSVLVFELHSEVVETYPELRNSVVSKLVESLDQIKASQVFRAGLWIIGEYSVTPNDIDVAFTSIKSALGALPLVENVEAEVCLT